MSSIISGYSRRGPTAERSVAWPGWPTNSVLASGAQSFHSSLGLITLACCLQKACPDVKFSKMHISLAMRTRHYYSHYYFDWEGSPLRPVFWQVEFPHILKHNAQRMHEQNAISGFVRVFSPQMHFWAWFTDELPTLGMHSNKSTCIIEVRTLETKFASATRLTM